jgi:hypothetical protein
MGGGGKVGSGRGRSEGLKPMCEGDGGGGGVCRGLIKILCPVKF